MLHELTDCPRFLLIGADHQFGWEPRRTARPPGEVIATVENDSHRRNVGPVMEPERDMHVYTDYEGRVSRFRRRR